MGITAAPSEAAPANVIPDELADEAALGTCSPDPHCSWKGDRCHCCYNGGCDFEEACKCGHAPPQPSCNPDPHCTHEGEKCKCCFNGGCDYEDVCKCGGPAFVPLDSHVEVADMGGPNSTEPNSAGMMEAVANLFCASIGEDCGPHSLGGLHWRKRCCGSARCQKFVGLPEGAMKCVEEHPVQPAQHCVAFNGECGGPGRQTQPCCIVGFSCKKENFFSVMKCMA